MKNAIRLFLLSVCTITQVVAAQSISYDLPEPAILKPGEEAYGVSWQSEPYPALTINGVELYESRYTIHTCTFRERMGAFVYPLTPKEKYLFIELWGDYWQEGDTYCGYWITTRSGEIIADDKPSKPYHRFWSPDERYFFFIEGSSSEYHSNIDDVYVVDVQEKRIVKFILPNQDRTCRRITDKIEANWDSGNIVFILREYATEYDRDLSPEACNNPLTWHMNLDLNHMSAKYEQIE